jgi:hypothetical protein
MLRTEVKLSMYLIKRHTMKMYGGMDIWLRDSGSRYWIELSELNAPAPLPQEK